MPTPRRYSNGVTNVGSTHPWGLAKMPYPFLFHYDFDDFYFYHAGAKWVTTSDDNNTIALTAGAGGLIRMATSKKDNSFWQIQRGGVGNLALVAGKRAFFGARFRSTEATQNDFLVGLATVDTSLIASAPTDGVYFHKDDGDLYLDFSVRAGGASVGEDTAIASMANDTLVTCEWSFDGVDTFDAYVNGTEVSTVSTSSFPTGTMVMSAALTAGQAAISLMTLDFIYVAIER